MGIPKLRSHLKRYSDTKLLGCRNRNCHVKGSAVIDGPSLAYHVVTKLLSQRNPRTKVNISYELVGTALIKYLETLEDANVSV